MDLSTKPNIQQQPILRYNIKDMSPTFIFLDYVYWHYSRGYADIKNVWLNILWFLFHFFSFGILLQTFFSPFRRIRDEEYQGGFDPGGYFASLIVTTTMRLVGMIFRSAILIFGLFFLLVVFVGGILFFIVWTLLPLLLFLSFFLGFRLLFL